MLYRIEILWLNYEINVGFVFLYARITLLLEPRNLLAVCYYAIQKNLKNNVLVSSTITKTVVMFEIIPFIFYFYLNFLKRQNVI